MVSGPLGGGSLAPQRMSNPPTPPAALHHGPDCCWSPWPRLLLGRIGTPGRGGCCSERLGGPPDQMRHIFPVLCGEWSSGVQQLPGPPLMPWLWGWCLVRLRPTAPLNSPPRRRGIPSALRSVGIHEEKGDVCVRGWGEPWDPWSNGCQGVTREIIRSITKRACRGEAFGR